jgi:hypothetical protein
MRASNRSNRHRGAHWLAGLALIGALVGAVAGAGSAEGLPNGTGELGERNLSADTLEIGDQVYHVTASAVIMDHEGNHIAFSKLPVRDHDDAPGATEVIAAEFSAIEVRGSWMLQRLELVEAPR